MTDLTVVGPDLDLDAAEKLRDRLLKDLEARQADIVRFHRYYDGDHDMPRLPAKANEDVRALRKHSIVNLCPLVVNAVDERLEVKGFKFSTDPEEGSLNVWDSIWQPNQMDAVSGLVMQEALIACRSFCLVWPDGDGRPTIYPETPSEVLVDYEPGTRGKRRAAIKSFVDGKSRDVTMWTADTVWRWRTEGRTTHGPLLLVDSYPNPMGVVPVVEFLSLPDLRGVPHSELGRGVLEIQDSINKTKYDRLVLQEFQAFPQRWATGIEIQTDEHGTPLAPFKIGPDYIAVNESETVKFGQWDAADLKPLLDATVADIHALAAVTKTPVHYLAAEFSNVSADAIRAAEAGLVKKIVGHQRTFGEAWEEVIRLALQIVGDERSADQSSFIEWSDPETRTVAELADATVKLAAFLPQEEVWARLGYSPQERRRFASAMAAEALTTALAVDPTEP